MRIGWIGLGKMGAPMAARLLAAGHAMTVWNRSPAPAAALAARGATVAATPAGAAAGAEALFLMLADDAALAAVGLGPGGAVQALAPGALVVEMSTVSPEVSARLAEAAAAAGADLLRAPVSGSVALATAGTLTVLASGPRRAFDRAGPLLAALSARQFYLGEGEEARVVKLAINLMIGTTMAMLAESLALAAGHGIPRGVMLDAVMGSAVASPFLGYMEAALRAADYRPAFETRQMAKDFDLALAAARDAGVPLPLAERVREAFAVLIGRGEGAQDFSRLVELASGPAGPGRDRPA
jgi:3-hydroxyisobutyrate dehydrogenase-like beta-hydroxyacid dehydrogenase